MMFSYFFFIWQIIKVLHALRSRSHKTGLKNIYIVSRIFPYEVKFTKPTFFVLAVVVIPSILLSFTIFIILVSSNKSTGLCPCFIFVLDNQINRCETYHYQYHFFTCQNSQNSMNLNFASRRKNNLYSETKNQKEDWTISTIFFFIFYEENNDDYMVIKWNYCASISTVN